jgi:sialic acid synthase SpsE
MAKPLPLVIAAEIAGPITDDPARLVTALAWAAVDALVLPDVAPRTPARLPYELADFGEAWGADAPLSAEAMQTLATVGAAHGLTVVPTVNDDHGLATALATQPSVLRLAADALTDLDFLGRVGTATTASLWVDTAMADLHEVEEALVALMKHRGRLTLIHGLATAVGRPEELNLRAVATLGERFAIAVGYHARAVLPGACTAAVALGATVVIAPFAPGAPSANTFDARGLATLAAELRGVHGALGDGDKHVQASEWAARDRRLRSLVARVDIARGQALSADMVTTAPPGIGLKPRALAGIVGRRAAVDIPAGTLVTLGMLE